MNIDGCSIYTRIYRILAQTFILQQHSKTARLQFLSMGPSSFGYRGGGVLVTVYNSLSSRQVFSAVAGELGAIFVEIFSHFFKILLATAYVRPSTSQKSYKDFVNMLEFYSVD